MLAYPIHEAEDLLDSKLQAAQANMSNCQEDLDFLREQITVSLPRLALAFVCTDIYIDSRGGYGTSVQLGCDAEEKGEG